MGISITELERLTGTQNRRTRKRLAARAARPHHHRRQGPRIPTRRTRDRTTTQQALAPKRTHKREVA
jgi:hypothetical protein